MNRRLKTLIISLFFMFFILNFWTIPVYADGTTTFENQIADFPASYKPYLRKIHEKYPEWQFEAVDTGLNWRDVIIAENSNDRSLVPKDASKLVKSHEEGYYNASTNTYKQVDAGWVKGNEIAIAYYMDPRNFLDETNIFQFELLSFSDEITVETIEKTLSNTFMYNSFANYYDSKGNYIKSEKKYAEIIYESGKKYNINPCFLAAKIKNEIVLSNGSGSGSVSGKYTNYEGYYNFYNIGAYSSSNPIANGLSYAKTGSTYGRPWTSPEKSIFGGAEYLASQYIAQGQDTGYFQKFNVAPYSKYTIYTHQYMTNISGANSQGYNTYLTYQKDNLLSLPKVFAIPIFENMPGKEKQEDLFNLLDTVDQYGKTTTMVRLRNAPNINGETITMIPQGTQVKILNKTRTNTNYYHNHLYYPIWYEVSFEYDGKIYTGYSVADYITITTTLNINKDSILSLQIAGNNFETPVLFSSNNSIVQINADGTLKAIKNGTAEITALSSKYGFDRILISVGNYSNGLDINIYEFKSNDDSITVYWTPNSSATYYEIILYENNTQIESQTTYENVICLNNLKQNAKYSIKIRAVITNRNSKYVGEFSEIKNLTVPSLSTRLLINGLKSSVTSNSVSLTWNKNSSATGYIVYTYNSKTKKYEKIATLSETSYTVNNLTTETNHKFAVKAYNETNNKTTLSESYATITAKTKLSTTKKINVKQTSSTLTLSWSKVTSATGYRVYIYKNKKWTQLGETSKTSYIITDAQNGKTYNYAVKAYAEINGKKMYADKYTKIKTTKLETPTLTISVNKNKCTFNWKEVVGITGYQIWYTTTPDGTYKKFTNTNKTSYTKSKLTSGTYYFKVRAYKTVSEGNYAYSAFSSVKTVTIK